MRKTSHNLYENFLVSMKITISFRFLAVTTTLPFVAGHRGRKCPVVEHIGQFGAPEDISFPPFYPAFTEYVQERDGHCLFISSFSPPFPPGGSPFPPGGKDFEVTPFLPRGNDFVVKVNNIDDVEYEDSPFEPDMEILTELSNVTWPNDIALLPDGVFDFPALLVPQGFFISGPGRLTAINLNTYEEYIIQERESPAHTPWFYHTAVFYDMNGDGLLDIITVRSPHNFQDPSDFPPGQLVWFKNPGKPWTEPWVEVVLFSGSGPDLNNAGPDILIRMVDFDKDEIPEFVCTSFFSVGVSQPNAGKVTLFGAPDGGWSAVNATNPVRTKTIVDDQGKPFGLEIVDLNGDKRPDLLLTNHQPYGATTDGRVFAVEQPQSGDIFNDDWTTHILKRGIEPEQTPGQIRLGPGFAKAIYPFRGKGKRKKGVKPWILVGGDQSSKVWLLSPTSHKKKDWEYDSEEILDLTPTKWTIGDQIGVKSLEEKGEIIIYIPVFEAGKIFVYRLKNDCRRKGSRRLRGAFE
jgi:hypothetical protein